jgi:hypothetical protein
MGAVYRARHDSASFARRQGGDVALEVMHLQYAQSAEYRERFQREAEMGVRLDHAGIVKVFELVMDGGVLALASPRGLELACSSCHHLGGNVPCSTCHAGRACATGGGVVVPALEQAFHSRCKGCHEGLVDEDRSSVAPVDCDRCHTERMPERLEGRLCYQRANHLNCIDCHREVAAERPSAPLTCSGCRAPGNGCSASGAAEAAQEVAAPVSTPKRKAGRVVKPKPKREPKPEPPSEPLPAPAPPFPPPRASRANAAGRRRLSPAPPPHPPAPPAASSG